MFTRRTRLLRTARGAVAAAAILAIGLTSAAPALGTSPAAPPKACGGIFIAGTHWLGGHGVHVHSNGADEGSSNSCGTGLSRVKGVVAGSQWQCVELVNRLYLARGWITTTWLGNAGIAFWLATPHNLVKKANGSVDYLGGGDVVDINEYYHGVFTGGHVFVVNATRHVTAGTVSLVSQNNSNVPQKPGSISHGRVTVSGAGGGWTYKVLGVIHAP